MCVVWLYTDYRCNYRSLALICTTLPPRAISESQELLSTDTVHGKGLVLWDYTVTMETWQIQLLLREKV